MDIWGATRDEWEAAKSLAYSDVRPCVCNPNLLTKPTKTNPRSVYAGTDFAKRPARVYSDGKVAGIYAWQAMDAESGDFAIWEPNSDHGCGLVGRTIHAIDIDIDDTDLADEIDGYVCDAMPFDPPARTRPGCGRRLLLYRMTGDPITGTKQVHHLDGGQIEWLFSRQFFVLAGMHHSGHRYQWPDGMPTSLDQIPAIDEDTLHSLMRRISEDFGAVIRTEARTDLPDDRAPDQVDEKAAEYLAVLGSDYYRETLPNGALSVVCPWHERHQSTDGARIDADPTKTVFYPSGLGGRDKPGFKCMHAGHPEKNVREFLNAIGYSILDEFDDPDPTTPHLTQEPPPIPDRNIETGLIRCTDRALRVAVEYPAILGWDVTYDTFRHQMQIRRHDDPNDLWRPMQDEDHTEFAVALNNAGMTTVNDTKLRSALRWTAKKHSKDEAQEWINALKWDGEDRISRIPQDVLGVDESPYHISVMQYLFSALAGRLITPGVKADMVVILQGTQGLRKSTMVKLLEPLPNSFAVHDFATSDADAARKLRGKSVVEIEELKGLSTKDDESIKAWITTTEDEWIPKYQEFATAAKRRFVPIATSNPKRVLSDATGNRRWLPISVCQNKPYIDTDFIKANNHQLWAQGAHMYREHGVMWQEAERLAKYELPKFTKLSVTALRLQEFISEESPTNMTTKYLLRHAMHKELTSYGAQIEVARIEMAMVQLGYVDHGDGHWTLPFL